MEKELLGDIVPITFEGVEIARPMVIAGPCSAESERQVLDTARALAQAGVKIFRAGLWKPRTRPGGFEGVGQRALPWLVKVKEETGMLVATEVATREHVMAALDAGIDILWIGARTSANPFAMQELADALEGRVDATVFVKNPVNPDLELWMGALQRIYNAGVRRLGAIHRGFSAYGEHVYRNVPQWHIPLELHRRVPTLPILCDPSHMGGRRELVSSISQQALDMGFDGLIVESHCDPDHALSDKEQQVTPETLSSILQALVVRDTHCSTESLALLRDQVDRCDNELLEVLAKRMAVCRDIGRYKKEHSMQVVQNTRYDDVLSSRVSQAAAMGLGEEFVRSVMVAIHEESVKQQIEILNRPEGGRQ